jgi:hypothetical protein
MSAPRALEGSESESDETGNEIPPKQTEFRAKGIPMNLTSKITESVVRNV